MAEAAKVIRMAGSGEQQLVAAIQSGMVSVDAERAYKQVLSDVQRLRKENRDLRMQLKVVERSRKMERECKVEAYRMVIAKDSDYQRARDWRLSKNIALMAIGGAVVAVSTIIAMM